MFPSISWIASVVVIGCQGTSTIASDEIVQERAGRLSDPATAGAKTAPPVAKRSWGPEQAVGAADVPGAGDSSAAWASQSADGQAEWLICEYAKPLNVIAIYVHENDCPGALVKVTAFGADGKEVTAWEGVDPTPRDKPRGISKVPIALGFDVQRIKLYLDSPAVPGWNEIDAVAIEDENGKQHWATNVEASSTYATRIVPQPVAEPIPEPADLRPLLEQLQNDVTELKSTQKELRREIRELKELLKASVKKE